MHETCQAEEPGGRHVVVTTLAGIFNGLSCQRHFAIILTLLYIYLFNHLLIQQRILQIYLDMDC